MKHLKKFNEKFTTKDTQEWAIWGATFYDKLFGKIFDINELEDTYRKKYRKLFNSNSSVEMIDALKYFFKFRLNELK